jgi:hypothetical protein
MLPAQAVSGHGTDDEGQWAVPGQPVISLRQFHEESGMAPVRKELPGAARGKPTTGNLLYDNSLIWFRELPQPFSCQFGDVTHLGS